MLRISLNLFSFNLVFFIFGILSGYLETGIKLLTHRVNQRSVLLGAASSSFFGRFLGATSAPL